MCIFLGSVAYCYEDALALRVWPNDIDFNFHMNNARYLSAMDYGRMHLLARAGLLEPILRSRWQPLVGAVWVTYRRSLPAFARFTLTSRLVCWDERWFYIEQIFTSPTSKVPSPSAGSRAPCAAQRALLIPANHRPHRSRPAQPAHP